VGPWWNPLLFEFRGRTITFQGQVPWLLAPWLIYGGVIVLARKSADQLLGTGADGQSIIRYAI
jgi:hypothetical protein